MKKKFTVEVTWSIRVGAHIEVEAADNYAAQAEALRLVHEDEDVAEDAAVQAHDALRESGAWSVGPGQATTATFRATAAEVEKDPDSPDVLDTGEDGEPIF